MKTSELSTSLTSPPAFAKASAGAPTPLHEKWRREQTARRKQRIEKDKKNTTLRPVRHFKYFILWGSALFIILMALSMTLFCFVFAPHENFFFNLSAAMVVSWMLILTLYYVWAIYFYNINRGRTYPSSELQRRSPHPPPSLKLRRARQPLSMKNGEVRSVFSDDTNPNSDETLGLPPGTVRGTLALSMLMAGMAMMIASLAMPSSITKSEIMIDHFEFLKTGFVMVIAFYFGSKSLEILRNRKGTSPPE